MRLRIHSCCKRCIIALRVRDLLSISLAQLLIDRFRLWTA